MSERMDSVFGGSWGGYSMERMPGRFTSKEVIVVCDAAVNLWLTARLPGLMLVDVAGVNWKKGFSS